MMLRWLEQTVGALLVLLILLDVFLTVLYARIGTGIISTRLAHLTWWFFRKASRPFGRHQGSILSFCGPVILLLLIAVWAFALACGTALIIQPQLGTAITTSSGQTPSDFITALYAGGSSMSIVGASDFTPQTPAARMLYLFTSLIGMSVISLTLTYLMQVYLALQQRNALGLTIHLLTAETGDAAELIAGLGPAGQFDAGYSDLAAVSSGMTSVKESHHFTRCCFIFASAIRTTPCPVLPWYRSIA